MQDYKYDLALSTYRGITGDYETTFSSVEEIHNAIRLAIDNDGKATIINPLDLNITENGTYTYIKSDDVTAYEPVTVKVSVASAGGGPQGEGYNLTIPIGTKFSNTLVEDMSFTAPYINWMGENGYWSDLNEMFYGCQLMRTAPDFDASKFVGFSNTFYNCYNLTSVPEYDLSNATVVNYMFNNCSSIVQFPVFNLQNCTDASGMFSGCASMAQAPELLNTQNIMNAYGMFGQCSQLQIVPEYDFSSNTNFGWMFGNCIALATGPRLNTQSATDLSYMFTDCTALQSVPLYEAGNCANINGIFNGCYNLTDVGGFKDLGKQPYVDGTEWFISGSPNLTRDSILNIFNNLYDRTTMTDVSILNITLGENISKLTEDDIAIATNKGWTLS